MRQPGSIPGSTGHSAAKAWLRALELTTPIARNPQRILYDVIQERAEKSGEAPALLSDEECLTYRALAERSNRYARWALSQGLRKGDTVCLLMPNRPEYLAIWLGVTRAGGTVSLLNTNLVGQSLVHCIDIVAPAHIISCGGLIGRLTTALRNSAAAAKIWMHGAGDDELPRIDLDIERYSGDKPDAAELPPVTGDDCALFIYTSGTTGLPKAAKVSHFRLMQWSHWFAGMMDTSASDRMYCSLPMYHSVGGACDRFGSRRRRLGRDPARLQCPPILERHHALGLHAFPVYRRAVPLSAACRSAAARDGAPDQDVLRQRTESRYLE